MKLCTNVAVMLLFSFCAYTQSPVRIGTNNTIGWYDYYGDFKLNNKWAIGVNYEWQANHQIKNTVQNEFRLGATYKIHPSVETQLGYLYGIYNPFGAYPAVATNLEHRFFVQIGFKTLLGKVELSNRIRYEDRLVSIKSAATGDDILGWNQLNRLRYEIKSTIPLKGNKVANKTPYLSIYDEIHIAFGKNVGYNLFNQNRLGVLLGYRFNDFLKIEAGYINQIAQQGGLVNNKEVIQYNSGVLINIRTSTDFSRKK